MEMTDTAPALPAKEPAWVVELHEHPTVLGDIADAVGATPFHVLSPAQFTVNLAAFTDAMVTAGVLGRVYYGKKANKAACFARACAEANAGVDVASAAELVAALAGGVRGADLVVTGPAKSADLLWLATRHGCLIAVDALDELDRIIALTETIGPSVQPVRILLRVLPAADPDSRFGLTEAELDIAIERCAAVRAVLDMEGFSFHLTGYAIAPRAWQAAALIDRCLAARERGLIANSISIGGGFAVDYVGAEAYQAFQAGYRDSWFHTNKTFAEFYPYSSDTAGAAMLTAILDSEVPGDYPDLAAKFARTGTTLLVEPGRALLDGAGFSVFPVQGYKPRDGHGFLTVAGLSLSLSEQWFASEYLPEPVLWPARPGSAPATACVGGSSCLESDMLTWRRIRFPQTPRRGDLLLYPNTAGYQMDSNESEFHQLPLPTKVVVGTGDRIRWRLDTFGSPEGP